MKLNHSAIDGTSVKLRASRSNEFARHAPFSRERIDASISIICYRVPPRVLEIFPQHNFVITVKIALGYTLDKTKQVAHPPIPL